MAGVAWPRPPCNWGRGHACPRESPPLMAVPGGAALALSGKGTLLCLPPRQGGWEVGLGGGTGNDF